MVWRQLHVGQLIETIGNIISIDFVLKLTRSTIGFVGSWIGRVARRKREIITKRLRQRRRRLEACRMVKRGRCKCNCIKCSSYKYVQRRRVLEPDYLANLAYQHRVSQEKPQDEPVDLRVNSGEEDAEDRRDLQQSGYNGVVWWTGVTHPFLMPPLYNEPTRSNCSTSGFRSGTPDIPESSGSSVNTSTSSDSSDYQSCDESSSSPRWPRVCSKSESKVEESPKRSKVTCASRSASVPLGRSPNLRDTQPEPPDVPTKRKRPVSSKTTTSHACDSFSTCVKCSKIASRPCKTTR